MNGEWLCTKCTNSYEDRRLYCGITDNCVSKMPPITECKDFNEGKKYTVEVKSASLNTYNIVAESKEDAKKVVEEIWDIRDSEHDEITDIEIEEGEI